MPPADLNHSGGINDKLQTLSLMNRCELEPNLIFHKSLMYDEDPDDWTINCPHCGEDMYDDADECPQCHMFVSPADFKKPFPVWLMIVIVLTIASFLLASIRL